MGRAHKNKGKGLFNRAGSGILLGLGLLILILSGCDNGPKIQLEGLWEVKDLDPNNAVVQYYLMMIEQDMTQVVLRREGEIVSQCVLGERHLDCSDWGGYGIQTIHVDDADHMYSDLPQNESLSRVEFVRISQ